MNPFKNSRLLSCIILFSLILNVYTQNSPAVSPQIEKKPAEPPEYIVPANFECDHNGLFHMDIPYDKMCEVATKHCDGDFVNFYYIFYCGFDQSMTALIFVGII